MAAGDRKVRIVRLIFLNQDPVEVEALWQYATEDNQGALSDGDNGTIRVDLGPKATAKLKTLQEVYAEVKAAVEADANVPARDGAVVV